tara:strand:+ start:4168 stop:5196 length:1029 start_codon:yes stop_codon:yes gene_type:complete
MKILITGIAGFTGSTIARNIAMTYHEYEIFGIDNLSRNGSERNVKMLKDLNIDFYHGDIRNKEDLDCLPDADWIIDCAAEPSVLAGIDGAGPSKLIGNNLVGTLNLLEYCRTRKSGFILLSTSRVYSINELNNLNLKENDTRFVNSNKDIESKFSTKSPISLYGGTKLASETMAMEYHYAFDIPVYINRCGVIAGPGQFGKIDQGIISFWIYQWLKKKPLKYIGFGGKGKQVRDFISPVDVCSLILEQIHEPNNPTKIINVGGSIENSISLKELSEWCKNKFGYDNEVIESDEERPFDIPYYVTDNTEAMNTWDWEVSNSKEDILNDIYNFAIENEEFVRNI